METIRNDFFIKFAVLTLIKLDSTIVLIDETGHVHLDLSKKGTSSHFIYTSVSLKSSDKGKFEKIRQKICLDYKLNDNLRGANLGEKDFYKRLKILDDLMQLDFTIDALVVDKSKIESHGLSYKHSFYKYFQTTFVRKHFDRYDECFISAEKVGSDHFKKELESFIRRKAYELDLFTPLREFQLVGKEVKLLQLTDFLANCLSKIFCTSELHDRAPELWDKISARTSVDYFPFISEPNFKDLSDPLIDEEIWKIGRETIQNYLNDPAKEEERKRVLKLLQTKSYVQPTRFVPTHEIIEYLSLFYSETTEEKVRRIIRDLRYDGLTVVSQSGKGGYKIATSYIDIADNVRHFMRYVEPMLQKLKVLNQTLSQNSHSKINPLEKDPSLDLVRKLLQLI